VGIIVLFTQAAYRLALPDHQRHCRKTSSLMALHI
jgi:hypothetical protein